MKSNDKLSFIKSYVGLSLSSWVNALLSFFATPIITRIFVPAELGKIQLFITIATFFANVANFGVDQAYSRYYHEPPGKNDKRSILTVCIMITGVVMLVSSVVIWLGYKKISESIIGYVWLMIPICLILSMVSQSILKFLSLAKRMEKNILLYNIQTITMTVISNISYVAVALYAAKAEHAIVFRTSLLFVAIIIFLIVSRYSMSLKVDISKKTVTSILKFSLPLCPVTILAVANNSIGQLLLKRYVDYSAIGIYSNAVTVAAIMSIIQNGFECFWGPYVYENYKDKQKQIIQMHHMISFSVICFALLIFFAHDLIYYVLVGKMYWASKQIFPLLIISPVTYMIAETLGMGIKLSKKTYLFIPVSIVNIIVNIVLSVMLIPKLGVIGAAVASALSSICMVTIKSVLGEKHYRCSDNYIKLIASLSILVATAVMHLFVYDSPIKYVLYCVALIIVTLLYMSQVKMIFGIAVDLYNKYKK